jgi:hypothetical protein
MQMRRVTKFSGALGNTFGAKSGGRPVVCEL